MKNNDILLRKLTDITVEDNAWLDEARFLEENKAWLDDSLRIASRVLVRMRKMGWNQIDLAKAMGVKPQQVSKWLKGKENFRLSTIKKLESALDTSLIHIQGEDRFIVKWQTILNSDIAWSDMHLDFNIRGFVNVFNTKVLEYNIKENKGLQSNELSSKVETNYLLAS
jgi:transcriptional regulator with XRE-family HTH domain